MPFRDEEAFVYVSPGNVNVILINFGCHCFTLVLFSPSTQVVGLYKIARPGQVTHLSSLLLCVFAFAAKNSGLAFLPPPTPIKEHVLECNLTDQFSSIHRRYVSPRKIYASLSTIKKEIWTTYPVYCKSKKHIHGWFKMERHGKLRAKVHITSRVFALPRWPMHVGLMRPG